jgi:hypothetical protein
MFVLCSGGGPVEGRLVAMLEHVPDLTLAFLNEATQAWVEHEYNRSVHSEIGAMAFAVGGFVAVLTMIAIAGIVGAALSRWIPETAWAAFLTRPRKLPCAPPRALQPRGKETLLR